MGLKSFFARWSKDDDERAMELEREESRMTPLERELDQQGYEGNKHDTFAAETFQGSEALDAFKGEMDS